MRVPKNTIKALQRKISEQKQQLVDQIQKTEQAETAHRWAQQAIFYAVESSKSQKIEVPPDIIEEILHYMARGIAASMEKEVMDACTEGEKAFVNYICTIAAKRIYADRYHGIVNSDSVTAVLDGILHGSVVIPSKRVRMSLNLNHVIDSSLLCKTTSQVMHEYR